MLLLSRRKNESIQIGDDVTVTVIDIIGQRVRLGVRAPLNTSVHRQEVYDVILEERRIDDAAGEVS